MFEEPNRDPVCRQRFVKFTAPYKCPAGLATTFGVNGYDVLEKLHFVESPATPPTCTGDLGQLYLCIILRLGIYSDRPFNERYTSSKLGIGSEQG